MTALRHTGEKYEEHKIWAPAWIRFEKKVLTLNEKVAIEVRRSISRGGKIRNMQRKSKPVEPLASFTEEGDLEWNTDLVEKIRELGKLSKGGGAGGRKTT